MPNTLLTPSIIAKEALMVLQNQMVLANMVHRDYSNEFAKVGDTISVPKPATFTAEEWNGSTITIQNAIETKVDVKMDKVVDVSFAVTSKDLALSINDFSGQFVQPAMRAHAQFLDSLLASMYKDIPYVVNESDTPVIKDIANIGQAMNINKVPQSLRSLVMDPTTQTDYVTLDAFVNAEKSGSTEALREASMGRVMGMNSFMDQNIKTHTKGTLAIKSAGATLQTTASAGTTTITIANALDTSTVIPGDILTFDGIAGSYTVVTGGTVASNSVSVTIYPGLASAASSTAVSIKASHVANLAFHKNAFALVSRPLAAPMGAAKAESITFNGISARVVYDYDMNTKTDTISIDFLCGVKTLTPELAVRFCN